ncbi:MAG: SAM hydrolase/SAM-dependent halogenase family protein [Actinomycetota bacterium]
MGSPPFRYITFLSDYGLTDEFVGVCHGVMLAIAPEVRIIDLTHGIQPQSVSEGALILSRSVKYFPRVIHLAIVDPGVGSDRLPIILETASGSWLVGPDNGLLMPAAAKLGGTISCRKIESPQLMLPEPSRTFHGRDVFAPAAAHLARGVPPEEFGGEVPLPRLVGLSVPSARLHAGHLHAVVLHVDRFGNLQLAISPDELAGLGLLTGSLVEVRIEGHTSTVPFGRTFAAVPEGRLVITEDSSGLLALAVNQGSAAARLGAGPGSKVIVGPVGA